jgi:hypothetical protein
MYLSASKVNLRSPSGGKCASWHYRWSSSFEQHASQNEPNACNASQYNYRPKGAADKSFAPRLGSSDFCPWGRKLNVIFEGCAQFSEGRAGILLISAEL